MDALLRNRRHERDGMTREGLAEIYFDVVPVILQCSYNSKLTYCHGLPAGGTGALGGRMAPNLKLHPSNVPPVKFFNPLVENINQLPGSAEWRRVETSTLELPHNITEALEKQGMARPDPAVRRGGRKNMKRRDRNHAGLSPPPMSCPHPLWHLDVGSPATSP
ncbi:hypothetical protein GN956_G4907 [Arapaima gigas]